MNGSPMDPITRARMLAAEKAASQQMQQIDPRMLYAQRCGLNALQLEELGITVGPCLCGCGGPTLSFATRVHWPQGGMGGMQKLPPSPMSPNVKPTETEQ